MKPKGFILYEGPSSLDQKPVVVIATLQSKNEKTGNLVGTWILRSDISPLEAIYNEGDVSICGDCKHRGTNGRMRTCYVNIHQAPLNIWKSYQRGRYTQFNAQQHGSLLNNRKIRLGSYGDPAAVPYEIWVELIKRSSGWTAYTHQWNNRSVDPRLKNICMASVDTPAEQRQAAATGWRTFRVRTASEPLSDYEAICPASEEAGKIRTCETCLACCGNRMGFSKDSSHICIIVHGKQYVQKQFTKLSIKLS